MSTTTISSQDKMISDLWKLADNMVSSKTKQFAVSLINQYNKKKSLSDKQWFYVDKILKDFADINMTGTTKVGNMTGTTKVGNLNVVEELFNKAKNKLKYPAVIFNIEGVGKVMVGIPYEPNQKGVEVCIKKQTYQYVGSVIEDEFIPKNKFYKTPERIIELLKKLSSDPVNTLIEYGKSTCICCFCGSGLEDPKSIKMGYGPVCASNYGLPW